ncbi:hypothetical protein CEXT_382321 [Caerostris extrusa]|uniref:Uncharacterized protein n=1 Tax=Caerostris extrusa TaxID=172846 RepID=A0AAV4XWL6_CAEEX|nr:hypothetical protein CEXT_382321 [Caerostris extrusa]
MERGWRIGEMIIKRFFVMFPVTGGEFTFMISLDANIKSDNDGVVVRGEFRERLYSMRKVKVIGESEVNSGSRVMAKTSRSRGCNDVGA